MKNSAVRGHTQNALTQGYAKAFGGFCPFFIRHPLRRAEHDVVTSTAVPGVAVSETERSGDLILTGEETSTDESARRGCGVQTVHDPVRLPRVRVLKGAPVKLAQIRAECCPVPGEDPGRNFAKGCETYQRKTPRGNGDFPSNEGKQAYRLTQEPVESSTEIGYDSMNCAVLKLSREEGEKM